MDCTSMVSIRLPRVSVPRVVFPIQIAAAFSLGTAFSMDSGPPVDTIVEKKASALFMHVIRRWAVQLYITRLDTLSTHPTTLYCWP